jgi:magnesium transporter
VLTVLSAVFLPLTLIAGIYGMNFEVMPELGYRFAYPLAIGSMVVLGLGMIAYFRSRGWFD